MGEREAASIFTDAGWTVRGLEGQGDALVFLELRLYATDYRKAITLHVEAKRYRDRARFPEWLAQVKAEAPSGVPPVLVTRADRGEWIASLPLANLLELIG